MVMKALNEHQVLPGIKVILLHGFGLVGKKDCPWAKDSIDFLIAVVKKDSSSTIELWGLEIRAIKLKIIQLKMNKKQMKKKEQEENEIKIEHESRKANNFCLILKYRER